MVCRSRRTHRISRLTTRSRNRFTPGVQFLIHANIKLSFEYQIRPQQFVTLGSLPNGNPLAMNPFRVNTALTALEFVY